MSRRKVLVEAAVESVKEAIAAERAGAGRIELCARLAVGGTTPDPVTVAECLKRIRIPINVMIRPRGGNFRYSRRELSRMARDIRAMRQLGVHGVVFGVLKADRSIDRAAMRPLVGLARPLSVTCHRAFDRTPDPHAALVALMQVGVDRVLTSGQAKRAVEGVDVLSQLVKHAGKNIVILAGGGVRGRHVKTLVRNTRVPEVHLRARRNWVRAVVSAVSRA